MADWFKLSTCYGNPFRNNSEVNMGYTHQKILSIQQSKKLYVLKNYQSLNLLVHYRN